MTESTKSTRRRPRALRARRRWAAGTVLVALVVAAVGAQSPRAQTALGPSLTIDTAFAPPSGVARHDFEPSAILPDKANGVAVHGDRIYTVGETRSPSSSTDTHMGIVARRTDGSLDTGFSEDGQLALSLASGNNVDLALSAVVLPDGRLRVVGATDVDPSVGSSSTTDLDVAIVGLNPDGSFDTTFGGGNGRVMFNAGGAAGQDEIGVRIAADPSGRLAVVGSTNAGSEDDFFVSLRNADGSAVAFDGDGVRVMDLAGGTLHDRGADVAFRPGGGIVALAQVDTSPGSGDLTSVLRAFRDDGQFDSRFASDGALVLDVGSPDTVPGGLIAYDGRLWATGSTKSGQDTDAFLARVNADGSGLQSRRFDMRGRLVSSSQSVVSHGNDLAVVPGAEPTLVVGGSVTSDAGTEWAAAAFNGLAGEVAAAPMGDFAVGAAGDKAIVGVAAGASDWVAVAGELQNSTSTSDTSFGDARLLLDVDKACDLLLAVVQPLELAFQGAAPVPVTLQVTNSGSRACAGSIAAPAPYSLAAGGVAGPIGTPVLPPGASYTTTGAELSYAGPRRRDDVVVFGLDAAGDVNAENNRAAVRARFDYCDLQTSAVGRAGAVPNEGWRHFEVSLRNAGTAPCRNVTVEVSGRGRRVSGDRPFTLRAGRSASDEVGVALTTRARAASRRTRSSRKVSIVLRGRADGDIDAGNDAAAVSPVVVRVGDTDARRPRGRVRSFSGVASRGRGRVARRSLLVRRVDVALRKKGKGCRWLRSSSGRFRKVRPVRRRCTRPVWVRARGTSRWRLELDRALASGEYILYSRATTRNGFREARFSARDRNRITFRVRR